MARFHTQALAEDAHRDFVERFQKKQIPDSLETQTLFCAPETKITHILKQAGLTQGTSESIRMIDQGAVKINGEKISDTHLILPINCTYIIEVGKRRLAKVNLRRVDKGALGDVPT